jgi:hypothetical protein
LRPLLPQLCCCDRHLRTWHTLPLLLRLPF